MVASQACRPHMEALKLGFGVEVKHNDITYFQPTLAAVTARTDLGRAINIGHHPSLQHTPLELFSLHLYFLE